jgi:protein SCO1/2
MTNEPNNQKKTNPDTPSKSQTARNKGFSRIFEKPVFWIAFIAIALGLPLLQSIRQKPVALPPVLFQLPDFELTQQDSQQIKLSDFRGSVLVVNFIFTSCPMVCPRLTQQMAKIQSRFVGMGPAMRSVSITVDPKTDTPEVLREYGEKYRANFRNWHFLTGDLKQIEEVVVNGFKMAMVQTPQEPAAPTSLMDITHGEHFVIVDQLGRIRAFKTANNDQEINSIVQTVAILANTNPHKAPLLSR